MKKFQIKIADPCHENWDAMTPQDKGRFCASCKKTVVDFSNMSDRQIADFFKRPAGSVCGRFHSDQLERPIEVPRKRIPWVKYFFQVTWPAFVLFLKSCGPKLEVMGDISLEAATPKKEEQALYTTMGLVLPEITPEDSLPVKKMLPSPQEIIEPIKGEIMIEPEEKLMGDTILLPIDTTIDAEPAKECSKPMDTVNIVGYNTYRMGQLITGGISVTKVNDSKKDLRIEKDLAKIDPAVTAFPNPVRAGEQVTIKASFEKDLPKEIQLYAANGQLITSVQKNFSKEANIKIFIPTATLPGTYFIQVITEKQQSKTVKILVIN